MQTSELCNIINKFPSIKSNFVGVFSIDKVPKRLRKTSFLIINTQPSHLPGQHWFCLIKRNVKEYELFDSLGVSNDKLNFFKENNIFRKNSVVKFNESPLQISTSNTCGLFVLYFLIHRMHNLDMSFSSLMDEIFDLNLRINEDKVLEFANDHFF